MTIPDYEALMLPILSISTEERSIRQAVTSISDQMGLTDEERAVMIPSGGKTLIKSRIEWAITYLVHAGLMTRPRRGHFVITARGKDVLANPPLRIDQAWQAWQRRRASLSLRHHSLPRPSLT